MILHDVIVKPDRLRQIVKKWNIKGDGKLAEARREAVKMTGRVRTFLKETKFSSAHRFFGNALRNQLQPKCDKQLRQLTNLEIGHQDAEHLLKKGFCTPREIREASLEDLVAVLCDVTCNKNIDKEIIEERAKKIKSKAERHLIRMEQIHHGNNSSNNVDEEEDEEEEEQEEEDDVIMHDTF
jgi:regulator of RNase E activity RraB